jgi:tetratricopeptide (TPR) repeat protein
VRKTGKTLRLSLRLLDTRDRSEIWSHAAETSMASIFDWRDSTVSAVASELGRPIEGSVLRRLAARRTTEQSFEHYAAGRFRWAEGAGGDLVEAMAQYDLALEADSGFAPTWAAMAHAYAELPRFTRFPVELVRADGITAARTALRLDPDGARGHLVLGEILYLYDHDFIGAGSHLSRALELEAENGEALVRLCELRMLEGETEAARDHCARALVADPLSFQAAWLSADLAKIAGDHESAAASLDSLRLLYPDYIPLAADAALTRLLAGDSPEARQGVAYWFQLLGGDAERAYGLWGDDPRAALVRLASDLDPEASNLAALGALLGEREIAIAAAESAVEAGLPGAVRFLVFPEFDGLRGTARFDALVAEILSGPRDGDPAGTM